MTDEVTIRRSTPADRAAVLRLAALDSKRHDGGALVLAERGGELLAAVPLAGGPALADPFRPTAEIVALLELRAAQLRPAEGGGGRARGARVPAWRRRRRGLRLRPASLPSP